MTYRNRLIVAFLFIFGLLFIFGFFLGKGLRAYYISTYEKFGEMFVDSTKYDVLLLGSSRVHRNVDTKICDSITGLSFYNGGISGATAFEMYSALEGYLEVHPPPKYLLLGIDLGIMVEKRKLYTPIFYLDFLNNGSIYNSLKEVDKLTPFYKLLPFLKIINMNDDLRSEAVKGLLNKRKPFDFNYKGFSRIGSRIGRFNDKINTRDSIKADIYNNTYLSNIVSICKENHINVIFFSGPDYNHFYEKSYPNYGNLLSSIKDFANIRNIPFLNFNNPAINSKKENFIDDIHLNEIGTKKFSISFASILVTQFKCEQNSVSVN